MMALSGLFSRSIIKNASQGSKLAFLSNWDLSRKFTIEIARFKDKETAEEAVYFNKEEEKLLRNLLKKVKKQADVADLHAAVGEKAAEESALREILKKYNVSDADMKALMEWKNTTFH